MDRKYSHIGANKIIQYNAIMWSKRKGFKKLHSGGGIVGSHSDSLMLFKAGFSKLRGDFYIAKRIHNHDTYRKLCAVADVDTDVKSFFPAYRSVCRT
jgi:lipid II:glycine glycyltransferase (peptidoglycan interpeptide bridge formation enzyme)